MKITDASSLSNAELTTELTRLAGGEREATVALIVHLAEFELRRLYEGAGFRTVFQYCMEVLHLTEDATFNRVETARVARRFPVVIDRLTSGALSPTTVRMMAKWLTPENHRDLFAAAAFKGKRQVEELIARSFPQADVPSLVRKLPSAPPLVKIDPGTADTGLGPAPHDGAAHSSPPTDDSQALQTTAIPSQPAASTIRPLAPDRYEIRFTASASTREKLRHAQDLLAHAVPTGDLAQVFDRALTSLVEELTRKKFAVVKHPRDARDRPEESRSVPAGVRRDVYQRDGGRCAFVARGGRRCNDRRFIEFHHMMPEAAGGKPTVENIQLRCRAHNGQEVDLFFGPGKRYQRDGEVHEPRAAYGIPSYKIVPFRNGTIL
jgi:hypothetical protein